MTTPEPEQPADDEVGDPAAQDTGDVAEVPEDQRAEHDDPDHPANVNDPVDLSDVLDDGQVLDVTADEEGAS